MRGKIIALVFVIFAICTAVQAQDKFSHPQEWKALVKGGDYKFNEGQFGHKCTSEFHCDGKRTCSHWGWCQGNADHTVENVKGPNYRFDEGPRGHKCDNEMQCAGRRTCSAWGWCQGTA